MQADGDVSQVIRQRHRHQFIRRGRLGIAEVRRPEQRRATIGDGLDQPLGGIQLELRDERWRDGEVRMREGVIPKLVALGHDAPDERNFEQRVAADDEEGSVHAARPERIEDGWCPATVRPVVEGQRDAMRRRRSRALDHVRRRDLVPLHARDQFGTRVHADGATAHGRLRLDAQDLALAAELHVVAGGNRGQVTHDIRHRARTDHVPERRIFGAQPPERDAARTKSDGGREFVPRRRRIKKPDLMIHRIGVGPGRDRIERWRRECNLAVMLANEAHHLRERRCIGGSLVARVVPVIAVGADRENGLVLRNQRQRTDRALVVP